MTLPANNIAKHNGETLNWFVGDAVSIDMVPSNNSKPTIFWCWGIPKGWNSINAKYCGRYNMYTREVTDIKLLSK